MTEPDNPENLIGDVDQNGKVEVLDLVLLQKYLHNKEIINQQQFINADISQDNIVNIYDFVLLKKLLLR
ncbi:MAG: dockerin type I repeat-containing protein [Oscillospiraceae bacterium]|nr:dockerin type I repeat-containing protein [Oscillospiraceae bacterium]